MPGHRVAVVHRLMVVLFLMTVVGASRVGAAGDTESAMRLQGFEKPRAERYEDYDVGGKVRGWRFDRRGFFLDGADQRALEARCQGHGRVEVGIAICPVFLYEGPREDLRLLGRGEYRFLLRYGSPSSASTRRFVRPLALRDGERDQVRAHGGYQDYLRPSRGTLRRELWVSPEPCGDVAGWKGRAREFLAGRPWAGMREEHLQAMLGGALKARELAGGGTEHVIAELGVAFVVHGGVVVSAMAKGRPATLSPDPDAPAPPASRFRSVPPLTPLTRSVEPLIPSTSTYQPGDDAKLLLGEEEEEREEGTAP